MNLKVCVWGGGAVGVSGCVCLYWGARPAGSNAGEGWGLTDSLIIDVFFGFAFMFHTVLPGWGNRALADQTRRSASLAQLEGLQSETTGRQVRAAKVASLSNSLRGWNFGALSSASERELPKILVNINAFFFSFFFLGQGGTRSVPDELLYATFSFPQEMKSCLHFTNKTENILAHCSPLILKMLIMSLLSGHTQPI